MKEWKYSCVGKREVHCCVFLGEKKKKKAVTFTLFLVYRTSWMDLFLLTFLGGT